MPVYEWECTCGRTAEELHFGCKPPAQTCACGLAMRRVVSRVAIKVDMPAASGADDMHAQHKAWMNSDAGRARCSEIEKEGYTLQRLKEIK